jgi:hypothetical protein
MRTPSHTYIKYILFKKRLKVQVFSIHLSRRSPQDGKEISQREKDKTLGGTL